MCGLGVFSEKAVEQFQWRLGHGFAIQKCAACLHGESGGGIAGEEGIAAEVLKALHAFQQCEMGLATQALGQVGGFPVDDFAGLRRGGGDGVFHRRGDIGLEAGEVQDYCKAMTADSATIADVLLPLALEGPYSYRIPAGMALQPGDYVMVPLGPRTLIGVVWGLGHEAPQGPRLRDVVERFDMPALPETHRKFVDWLSAYYLEPAGNVLRMVLRAPGALAPPREQVAYRASGTAPKRMTPQRARVLEAAREGFAMRAGEFAEAAGVGTSVVKAMVRDGSLEAVALPALKAFAVLDLNAGGVALSRDQEKAAQALRAAVTARGHRVVLLDGVTGSGKTEVYFEAMAAALAGGAQVLLLLPEIALTQSFLSRVENRFGCEPAQWHSEVRPRERERVWRGVATGEARIVVGARSALFLPWKRLGLIVVDEEHEGAYKQDDGVSYHARDMAVLYGTIGKFPVVLSSATPSLESFVNVDRGRYGVVKLADRHGRPELPEIGLIDMKTVEARVRHVAFGAAGRERCGGSCGGRTGAAVSQPAGLCAAHLVPGLRAPDGMSQLRGVAGGAPVPAAIDVPSLRAHGAGAAGVSALRGGGQAGAGGARRRAAGGRGGQAFPRGADDHPVERSRTRHHAARSAARCGTRGVQSGDWHAAGGQGASFSASHTGGGGRCRSGARVRAIRAGPSGPGR